MRVVFLLNFWHCKALLKTFVSTSRFTALCQIFGTVQLLLGVIVNALKQLMCSDAELFLFFY